MALQIYRIFPHPFLIQKIRTLFCRRVRINRLMIVQTYVAPDDDGPSEPAPFQPREATTLAPIETGVMNDNSALDILYETRQDDVPAHASPDASRHDDAPAHAPPDDTRFGEIGATTNQWSP